MDWSKIGAIATIIGVVVAIIGVFISKKNSHKTNNQVIKGKVIKNNKIVQTKSNSGSDDNDQIIDVKKLYDNDIKQEKY
ncbi:MotA/TolQ/ExbB proton channel family protein [Clostridium botulinum]|nr:MotA/TolQ/ExbB proton channel family protein [Clostridium botulinum]NFS97580.1 MotA/TolQ/ExbB proton channel family protein [Clostridium botulinum]